MFDLKYGGAHRRGGIKFGPPNTFRIAEHTIPLFFFPSSFWTPLPLLTVTLSLTYSLPFFLSPSSSRLFLRHHHHLWPPLCHHYCSSLFLCARLSSPCPLCHHGSLFFAISLLTILSLHCRSTSSRVPRFLFCPPNQLQL